MFLARTCGSATAHYFLLLPLSCQTFLFSTMDPTTGYKLSSDAKFNTMNCWGHHESEETWKELDETEQRRRQILRRVELPIWRVLTFWDGTCLGALVTDWIVWVPIAIFCFIRFQARYTGDDKMPEVVQQLGDTDIDVLGGFLSFLLVLFVNQTNTRFFEMYQLSKKVAGRIQDVAGLASTQLPPAAAHRIVRYMNAAHIVGYVGLGGVYKKHNFFDHFNQKHHLLSTQEMARVEELDMESGSAAFKELVTWCQRDVGRAEKAQLIDRYEAEQMHRYILDIRAAMDGIYDYCDQPSHFFYIHFLCLLSALYLPLFAIDNGYSAGWGDESDWTLELINGLIVLLQSAFVVGLRLLGQKMIDPYGDDWEDLSVITYISTTIENSRIIMTTKFTPEVDDALEELLMKRNEQVGHAA